MEKHYDSLLRSLASQVGLICEYQNYQGKWIPTPVETLSHCLQALSFDVSDVTAIESALNRLNQPEGLSPVYVRKQSDKSPFEAGTLTDLDVTPIVTLVIENGKSLSIPCALNTEKNWILHFPDLPLGYHNLQIDCQKHHFSAQLIVVPEHCYSPVAVFDKKRWGVNVQLYGLRSENNWGIGDFGDVSFLIKQVADLGGDFVGINPIHALFSALPENASPYSPSSRQWLNYLTISMPEIPEAALSSVFINTVSTSAFQKKLAALRCTDWVDYDGVAALKLPLLKVCYDTFCQHHRATESSRYRDFLSFVEHGGQSLFSFAVYEALQHHLLTLDENCWGWVAFPPEYQSIASAAVLDFQESHSEEIHFYLYVQWIIFEQRNRVQVLAKELGMAIGLYQDLAVGVNKYGAETWQAPEQFCLSLNVGAPPDPLGPNGQNWGLPPYQPKALLSLGYQPLVQLYRQNMAHAGALRLDHVLGLLRLWWVPDGVSATHGAYFYQDLSAMLGILALESHRAQCIVIGEDLGTVPADFRQTLQDNHLLSYKVFFFETAKDGGYYSPQHYPMNSLTTLCTHDMPPLAGYWQGEDIRLAHQFGWLSDEEAKGAQWDRQQSLLRASDSVHWHGFATSFDANDGGVTSYLSEELHYHLASGNSALLSVQLEDILGMTTSVNVPGTCDEYPNWRRKLPLSIDAIFSDARHRRFFKCVTQLRKKTEHESD